MYQYQYQYQEEAMMTDNSCVGGSPGNAPGFLFLEEFPKSKSKFTFTCLEVEVEVGKP